MPRTKKKVTELITKDQAVIETQNYAEANSQLKELEAQIEQKIQAIREEHASDQLTLITKRNEAFDKLQYYAEFNKDDLFSKKKSMDMAHGTIGFRLGTPKVKAIGITLAKGLELVRDMKLKWTRVKVELDKDKIIASREDEKLMAPLKKLGLHVVQEETFYVEPKEENLT